MKNLLDHKLEKPFLQMSGLLLPDRTSDWGRSSPQKTHLEVGTRWQSPPGRERSALVLVGNTRAWAAYDKRIRSVSGPSIDGGDTDLMLYRRPLAPKPSPSRSLKNKGIRPLADLAAKE